MLHASSSRRKIVFVFLEATTYYNCVTDKTKSGAENVQSSATKSDAVRVYGFHYVRLVFDCCLTTIKHSGILRSSVGNHAAANWRDT